MAHFVRDDVAEREGEQRWGTGHRRDAVAEDVRAPAGELCLAEYMVRDAEFPGFNYRPYDVSPDGKRFLMIKETADERQAAVPRVIIVVRNWDQELKRLVPTN